MNKVQGGKQLRSTHLVKLQRKLPRARRLDAASQVDDEPSTGAGMAGGKTTQGVYFLVGVGVFGPPYKP